MVEYASVCIYLRKYMLFVNNYMCIRIYTCITYIYIHMFMYIYGHTYKCGVCVCARESVCVYMDTYICAHTYVHTLSLSLTHARICM